MRGVGGMRCADGVDEGEARVPEGDVGVKVVGVLLEPMLRHIDHTVADRHDHDLVIEAQLALRDVVRRRHEEARLEQPQQVRRRRERAVGEEKGGHIRRVHAGGVRQSRHQLRDRRRTHFPHQLPTWSGCGGVQDVGRRLGLIEVERLAIAALGACGTHLVDGC